MLLKAIRRKAQLLMMEEKDAVESILCERNPSKALLLLDKLSYCGCDAISYDKNIENMIDAYNEASDKYNKRISNPIIRPVSEMLKAKKADKIRRSDGESA